MCTGKKKDKSKVMCTGKKDRRCIIFNKYFFFFRILKL